MRVADQLAVSCLSCGKQTSRKGFYIMHLGNDSLLTAVPRNPALLGAWITILMLGLQPFVQQTVNIVDYKWINMTDSSQFESNAQILRAQYSNEATSQFQNTDSWVDPSFQASVYQGFAPSAINVTQPSALCSMSNCTWEPYHTLAVCASTTNITESIIKNCTDTPFSQPKTCTTHTATATADLDYWSCNQSTELGATNCTWEVPNSDTMISNHSSVMFTRSGTTRDLWVSVNHTFDWDMANKLGNEPADSSILEKGATFAEVYVLARDYNNSVGPVTQQPQMSPAAFKVDMSFCLLELQTLFVNGTSNTTVLSQDTNPKWQTGNPNWKGESGINSNALTITVEDFDGPHDFTIPASVLASWGNFMGALFDGNASFLSDDAQNEEHEKGWSSFQSSQMMDLLANDAFVNPDYGDPRHSQGVEFRFNNIAQSLTNA